MKNPSKHVGVLQHHGRESPGLVADSLKRAGTGQHYIRPFEGNSVPYEIGNGDTPNGVANKLNAHTHLQQLQKIGRPGFARWVALFT
jgi:hypothetical protein